MKTNCDVPALWLEHKEELRKFIYKRVKEHELREDILQEVLIKIYNFCISRSGVRNVRSWLFQIAHNTLMDHYRRQSKFILEENIPDHPIEDENMAFSDALNYIKPMIDFLPPKYSVPLRLSDIEGLKQADIGRQLGLSLPAVKSRIQRARQLLKAEFISCTHFETDTSGNIISFEIKDSCKPLQLIKKNISK